ncbi:MAG: Nif3-like dinuclear metal center hexameric protein [Betaproteobacteria bacterium]|nr:Nif3-like dinuclear metal center hexameric protein [Betaproteobacteria bacterium]
MAKTAQIQNTVSRELLSRTLSDLLETGRFTDYCPNGLQVEGKARIRLLVTGVTASLAFLEAAIAAGADAVLVHHGWFWRGEDPRIIGTKRLRLAAVVGAELNLYGYHLPLDAHPSLGNNAQLARRLDWPHEPGAISRFGDQGIGWCADLPSPTDITTLCNRLERALNRAPLAVGAIDRPIRRLAWCTGAAHSMLAQAIDAGADAFVSGEINEPTVHLAREAGVIYIAAGHHATERWGVQAVGAEVAHTLGIEHRFIDDPNPV